MNTRCQCRSTENSDRYTEQWKLNRAKAIEISRNRPWAKQVQKILRIHLCYTNIDCEEPDQVLARLLILIEDLTHPNE